MADSGDFAELLQRVRAGDDTACAELMDKYGPELRRMVRVRLAEPLLQSTVDSADICQSVLLNFFVRVRLGAFEFDSPRDLLRLLTTMARHKLLNHVRRARTERVAGQPGSADWLATVPGRGESPSEAIATADLITRAGQLLTPAERVLAEHRRAGRDWAEIARLTGDTPEAARKRLGRAADRIVEQLGLQPETP
jgi:RNA polymerase sigma factor (sigma-70 family)